MTEMRKLTIKCVLTDGRTVSKTFDKIVRQLDEAFVTAFIKSVLPLYDATTATYTVYTYYAGRVESE